MLDAFFRALAGHRPEIHLPPELGDCAELIRVGWHQEGERRGSMEEACKVLERLSESKSWREWPRQSAAAEKCPPATSLRR